MNKGFKIIALAILLTMPLSAGAFAMGDKPSKDQQPVVPCKEIRLKMGETFFSLPADVKGFYAENGYNNKVKTRCYRGNESDLIDVTFFANFPGEGFPMQGQPRHPKDGPFWGIQIKVRYNPNTIALDQFEQIQKELKAANVEIQELPIENGFYVWERKKGNHFYISADPTMRSLTGFPLTVGCSGLKERYSCRVSIPMKNVDFGVGIFNIPPSRWKEFYQALLQYRDSILVKSNDQQQEVKP